jgi:hypothetical protein
METPQEYHMDSPGYIVLRPSVYNALLEALDALSELADLIEDAYKGEYKIDYFTTQPARRALRAFADPNPSSHHVRFTSAETVWQSRTLDTSRKNEPFVPLDTDTETVL